jgi:ATP-binding protein involved in chromosome partitioning
MTIIEGINAALATVQDPELHRTLPELGMVESVSESSGVVDLTILLTISGCPMKDRLTNDITAAVGAVEGVKEVRINFGVMTEEGRNKVKLLVRGGREKFIPFAQPESLTRVIGVASGKGGGGK